MKHVLPFFLTTGIFASGFAFVVTAQAAEPLSAIDWLSQSVNTPTAQPVALPRPRSEPAISQNAASPRVTVTSLDAPSPDPVGLLPSDVTGLPRDLWANSDSAVLARLIVSERVDTLPAIRELMMTLLLAQADAPLDAGPEGVLFLARIDKLLDLGALDPALALLEQVDHASSEVFRRWFDVALLTGAEDEACDVMRITPSVAPTFPARIFCQARGGDWATAALTLNTHRVLGDVTPQEEALLTRFLDAALFEDGPPLPAPDRISPLMFRMHEAIGEPLPTSRLPNAFAHADLRTTTGWKARLDAAERLARTGAISPNVLHGIYTANTPAASGGVWDRAAAVQRLDVAIASGDVLRIDKTLPVTWDALRDAKLEVPFAMIYASKVSGLPLTGYAASIGTTLGLLSPDYETVAQNAAPDFLTTLAMGMPVDPQTSLETAIYAAFHGAAPAPKLETLARNGQLGQALLQSINTFNAGFAGDQLALTQALAFWRFVGLEDVARKAALQVLILDRSS